MRKKKCTKELYCQFLIAAHGNYTATNASNHLPDIAHDSITRFLSNTKLTPRLLWKFTQQMITINTGVLILDDSVSDHWYGMDISLARWQYSGAHHRVVHGIGVTTLLWTGNNNEHIPIDYRIYNPDEDGMSKNEHAREMLCLAHHHGILPSLVVMDSWYASVDTLHAITDYGWDFASGIRSNRVVFVKQDSGNMKRLSVGTLSKDQTRKAGVIVHLKDFGTVKVMLLVAPNGKEDYYITNNINLSPTDIRSAAANRWKIEEYHRGLKQTTGIAKCQSRTSRSQRTHIFCSILSFVALEKKRLEEGITWYESKRRIIADALFSYLSKPLILLPEPCG